MKRFIAILLAFLILLPNQAVLAEPVSMLRDLNETRDLSVKLAPEVVKTQGESGLHDYLIQMESSLVLEQLPVSRQLLAQGLTQKQARGVATVQALKSEALMTQQPILQQLEKTGFEYESFHIANMIWLRADYQTVEQLAMNPAVRKIYADKETHISEMIPSAAPQAGDATPLQWNIKQINADQVWNDGITGQGIVVGVIDTGTDWTHPALKQSWRAYNPANPDQPLESELAYSWFDGVGTSKLPFDDNNHGTHCAGTILGHEPDGSNQVGVAPGAKWITAKAFNSDGGGSFRAMLRAAEWMLAPGGDATKAPNIVNNSWGVGDGVDDWFRDIVRAWRASGIVPLFAAGNQGLFDPAPTPGTIENPSNYPESIAVAATDIDMKLGSFSKLGPSPYDPSLIKPEISAPGVAVRSSMAGGGYEEMDGTSMATPHIAGVAALMLSANQNLSVDDILQTLEKTATPLTNSKYPVSPNMAMGYGLVNAKKAVDFVSGGLGQLKGTVLTEGTDNGAPGLTMNPGQSFAFMDADYVVTATASDDVSIVKTELLYKWQADETFKVMEMKRTEGDEKNGTYTGIIPKAPFFSAVTGAEGTGLKEGEMTYKVRTTDFAGNILETEPQKAMLSFGMKRDNWKEEFQGDLYGWFLLGDWKQGSPKGYAEPAPLIGDKYVGTNVGASSHHEDTVSYLITPPIDLRDDTVEEATFKFRHYFEMAKNSSVARVMVTDCNGEEWFDLTPEYFTGKSDGWQADSVSLSKYVGTDVPVYLAFILTAGGYVEGPGWYINQVELEGKDVTAPVPPTEVKLVREIEGLTLNFKGSYDGDTVRYDVYRSSNGGDFTKVGETTTKTYMDTTVEDGVEYTYKIRSVDGAANAGDYSEAVSGKKLSFDTLIGSDFEANDGGFTTQIVPLDNGREAVNSWEYGKVVKYGPGRAWSGEKLWATIIAGDYLDDSSSRLLTPEIVVPEGDGTVVLNFRHWYDGEKYWSFNTASDYGLVEVTADGGQTWDLIPNAKWAGHIREWQKGMFDLSAYKGKTIQVAFRFVSDKWSFGSETFIGWYVDDIGVYRIKDADFTVSALDKQPKAMVAPEKMTEPGLLTQYKPQVSTATLAPEVKANPVTAIPMREARVEVVEKGISVPVNAADGTWSMRFPATEKATLKASAYGYYPETRTFTLTKEGTVEENFVLKKIPRSVVTGTLTDINTGKPVVGAQIRLLEDGKISPVVTDETGKFTLKDIFAGSYTLHIYHPDYEIMTVPAEAALGDPTPLSLKIQPFVPYRKELSYDDGTAENAVSLSKANYGYGVVFQPEELAHVKSVRAFFWGNDYPIPGGNEIQLVLMEVNDYMIPQQTRLCEPMTVTVRRGEWNTFDVSSLNLKTDKPFMAAFIQPDSGDYCPAISVDNDTELGNTRSYIFDSSMIMSLPDAEFQGGFMIRAEMDYSMDTPVITGVTPARQKESVYYTDQEKVELQGEVSGPSKIELNRNGSSYATVSTATKSFKTLIKLESGMNEIKVRSEVNGAYTQYSAPVKVVRDQVAPAITLTEPTTEVVTSRVLDVKGQVKDENLETLTINGKTVATDKDGSFAHSLILKEGINIVEIKATDLAGNATSNPLRIDCQPAYAEVLVTDAAPAASLTVYGGEQVKLHVESNLVGANASFQLSLPAGTSYDPAMTEVAAGVYEATWTVPAELVQNDIKVTYALTRSSQRAVKEAEGRIHVRARGIRRISGTDRYATASAISQFGFERSERVVLANGNSFADAMVGGILAGQWQAPVLLTDKAGLSESLTKELERLEAKEITLIGGELAISSAVEAELKVKGYTVNRISGANRYATAAKVAGTAASEAETVYLASGTSYADAMSFAPLAGQMGATLLLTDGKTLSPETKAALSDLKAKKVVLIGGNLALSDNLENEVKALNLETERIQGANRYATNQALIARFYGNQASGLLIASGETYADALTGAGLAAKIGQPLVLVKGDQITETTLTALKAMAPKEITVLGGTLRITDAAYNQLANVLK
ncbi:Subtilase family protein [anaerobic digester metagenome]